MSKPLFLFFLLFLTCTYSQSNSGKAEELEKQAEELLYEDPEKALKIAEEAYHLTKETKNQTFADACSLISTIHSFTGKHEKSIRYAEEAKEIYHTLGKINYEADMLNLIGMEYSMLGLFDEGLKNNWEAIVMSRSNIAFASTENNRKILAQSYDARSYIFDQQYTQFDSILFYNRLAYSEGIKLTSEKNIEYKAQFASNLANTLLKKNNKSEKETSEILEALTVAREIDKKLSNLRSRAYIAFNFGNYYYTVEKDSLAIAEFTTSLELAKKLNDLNLQKDCHKMLANLYSLSRNKDKELEHQKLNNELLREIEKEKRESVNTTVKNIQKTQQQSFFKTKKNLIIISLIIGILLLTSIFAGIINHKKSKKELTRFRTIMEKLEKDEFIEHSSVSTIEQKNAIPVPEEIEIQLLKKLKKFESSQKFTSKNLLISTLANSLGTNTTYLSSVINQHKNKNFNNYINELRVNYIIQKLNTDPKYLKYKISHLAEEAGFSTHDTFTTTFKNLTGISPSQFIKLLHKNR